MHVDWTILFLDFIASIAWPAVLLATVLVFRRQFAAFLTDLEEVAFPGGNAKRRFVEQTTALAVRTLTLQPQGVIVTTSQVETLTEEHQEITPWSPEVDDEIVTFRAHVADEVGGTDPIATWRPDWHNPYGLLLKAGDVLDALAAEATNAVDICVRVADSQGRRLIVGASPDAELENVRAELRRLRLAANDDVASVTEEGAQAYAATALAASRRYVEWAEDVFRRLA